MFVTCVEQAGPSWPAVAAICVASLSVMIALLALFSTRAIARRKATLDLIEKRESTDHYREISATFSRLRRTRGFAHLTDPADETALTERRAVLDFLNHYELIAIGIRGKTLDGAFYRQWMMRAFIRDWNDARPFIQQERWRRVDGAWVYFPSVYQHFGEAAQRWSGDALPLDRWSFPPAGPTGGPGDEALPEVPAGLG